MPQCKRERFSRRDPVLVTQKLLEGLPNLCRGREHPVVRVALRAAQKDGFRIVHFAVLSNHVHTLIEAA